jgi:hypothetical protein
MLVRLVSTSVIVAIACSPLVDAKKKVVDRRSFEVDVRDDKVSVDGRSRLEAEYGKVDDRLTIDMETKNDNVKFNVAFKHKADAASDLSVKFDVRFYSIIEFTATDATVGFQDGVDTPVQMYPNNKWSWGNWASSEAPLGGGTKYDFNTATEDGVFTIHGAITDTVTARSESPDLGPNSMKLDFGLNEFPYQGQNTMLCIKAKVHADVKIKNNARTDNKDDNTGKQGTIHLDLASAEVAGLWSWVSTVQMWATGDSSSSGSNVNVFANVVRINDKDSWIYYTFNTTSRIKTMLWDPEAGVDYLEVPDYNDKPASSSAFIRCNEARQFVILLALPLALGHIVG